MRRSFLVLAALFCCALTLSVQSANAAPACASVADQSTYDVLALREMMTVLVTKCKREAEYNDNFIRRFQPVLQANERAVIAYFRRVYGGSGLARKETFTTELANVMSQQANPQGAEFCPRTALIVREMNALTAMDQLPAYAAVKDLAPPGMSMCPSDTPRRR
jgi:hypothetical protein